MDKIFDKEVQEYLKSSGVSKKEINKIKFNKLKEFAVNRLKTIANLIEQDKFDEIKPFTQSSPSGDGYGCDNDFIDFSEVCGYNSLDIIELCFELQNFKTLSLNS